MLHFVCEFKPSSGVLRDVYTVGENGLYVTIDTPAEGRRSFPVHTTSSHPSDEPACFSVSPRAELLCIEEPEPGILMGELRYRIGKSLTFREVNNQLQGITWRESHSGLSPKTQEGAIFNLKPTP